MRMQTMELMRVEELGENQEWLLEEVVFALSLEGWAAL